ncbi:hypothetical protein [Cellulomonas sp. SLBN-39]|uniref:hypothetical protein n=1 Tax=Cellulomonas sp. SLBN-39 TaxID=2768446 RepID=UPI0011682F21|nr:hypothetical protein [Cellulomonas sp. SLBN-39]TQL03155.1 hypothetical protein FBY24_2249 [Cellulomonas sp. SLBN-39]
MTTGDIPEVLRAPTRAGAARFPWLGYPFTSVGSTAVHVDWEERPVTFRLVSEGTLFSRARVNDREVFVDRRCGRALEKLWAHG